MIDPGEVLLADTGIDHALGRRTSRLKMRSPARPLEGEIETLIRSFFGQPERTDAPSIPTFDYDKALDELSSDAPPDHGAMADIPSEVGAAYFGCVTRAVGFLRGVLPRSLRKTMTGVTNLPPSDLEVSDFRRAWAVGGDPLLALRYMNAGMLTRGMVVALKAMYPSIYAAIGDAVRDEAIRRVGRAKDFTLPDLSDAQLQTLMQINLTPPARAAKLQQQFADDKQPTPPAPGDKQPRGAKPKGSIETPIQRIART